MSPQQVPQLKTQGRAEGEHIQERVAEADAEAEQDLKILDYLDRKMSEIQAEYSGKWVFIHPQSPPQVLRAADDSETLVEYAKERGFHRPFIMYVPKRGDGEEQVW